ncbi:MAG: HYR domain-containing protein [Phycisphaerae bacterium]|jgi:hypothetical protein
MQRFVVYNTTAFDQIQFAMAEGSAFTMPDGFDRPAFIPDTWDQACNDSVRLIATGPETNSLEFWVKFDTPLATPFMMYYQVYGMSAGMLTEITAAWNGEEWTLAGDSPWSNARVDCACLHMGSLSLLTDPADQVCYGIGDTVTINVFMSDIMDPYAIVGGQFFLSYNAAKLQFVEMTAGEDPFLNQIYEHVDPLAGTIDYGVGLNFGGVGTIEDSVMAVITFTAINEICLTDSLVTFRDNEPPSMLTSGCCGDVCPLLYELAAIEIDSTPPAFDNCSGTPEEPAEVTVECHLLDSMYPVYDSFGNLLVTAQDVCDDPDDLTDDVMVTFNEEREDGPCDATYTLTRTWTATDFCGNAADCVMIIHVQDTTAPCLAGCPRDATVECSDLDTLFPVYDEFDNLLVTATDNCDPNPVVSFTEEREYPDPECLGTFFLTRVWEATDECGNTAYCEQFLTVQDTTAPEWVDPDNLPPHITVTCDAVPEVVHPLATDNCAEPRLTYTEDVSEHGECQTYTITRTWVYDDYCGNSISHTQLISVVDNLPPQFAFCPEDVTVECDAVPEVPVMEATDNCPDSIPEVSFVEFQTMLPNPACPEHYRLRRAWTATDGCGNSCECVQLITVVDTTPPEITCPEPIVVKADVGTCEAVLCPGMAAAEDNCDDHVDVFGFRDDGLGVCSDPYPVGTTTITWTARDNCGNENSCDQTVTVLPYNDMLVSLAIQASFPCQFASTLERCITFELWNCSEPGMDPVEYETMITFECPEQGATVAVAMDVLLEDVPCGLYTCVTARDKLHSLRVTLGSPEFAMSDNMYVADFIGAEKLLVGGNANDDCVIDIRDYGFFICEWALHYDSNGDFIDDGNTPCGMFIKHADFDGNGIVWQEDYMYIRDNFLFECDPDCCVVGRMGGKEAITRISVAELRKQGLGDLVIADLNRDGWLDTADMNAFMQGVRPQRPGVSGEVIRP